MGRVEKALDELIVADELEPCWILLKVNLIEAYLEKGDLVNAVETSREVRELDPSSSGALVVAWAGAALQDLASAERFAEEIVDQDGPYHLRWASLFLSLNGRTAEAAARHLARAYQLVPHPVGTNPAVYSALYSDHATLLGYAHLKTGNEDRARRLFDETEQYYTDRIARGDTSIRARVGIAAVHALRGDDEAAYRWLQQAIDAGFYAYAELERHPCFESLHGDERFQQMMAGVRVKVDEMRRRVDALEAEG